MNKIKGIEITHPEKVLFKEAHVSKLDVANYYVEISSKILPFLKNYPITLRHFPHGIEKEGFYHKHVSSYYPKYIPRFVVPLANGVDEIEMMGAGSTRDLVFFAEQNAIEIHVSLSSIEHIKNPDQIIFDLDPSDDDFEKVREVAFQTKAFLDNKKINSFLKTTGSRGLHIHIPIEPIAEFSVIKPLAKQFAQEICKRCPFATIEHRKDKRKNLVFVDYLRNDYGFTAVAPYSLRATKNAAIAMPVNWIELESKLLGPQSFTLQNIFQILSKRTDPWRDFIKSRKINKI